MEVETIYIVRRGVDWVVSRALDGKEEARGAIRSRRDPSGLKEMTNFEKEESDDRQRVWGICRH